MASKANEILIKLKAENKGLTAKLKDSEKKITGLTKKITSSSGKIGSALKRAGGLIAVYFGISAIKSFINLAGEVDSVSGSFYNLAASAKGGADGLVEALQIASKGTVSNIDIMKTSNLALQLMGEQVADQLPKMMEIAMATAKASGKKTADMFNDIVVASGRQSVMILDNLGISSSVAAKHQEDFAAKLGKTRDQLDATQKSQAFFYAVMQSGNDIMKRVGGGTLTFGQRLQVISSRISNAGTAASRILIPALENVLSAFMDIKSDGGSVFITLVKQIAHFINYFGYAVKMIDAWIDKSEEAQDSAYDGLKKLKEQQNLAARSLDKVAQATGYADKGWVQLSDDVKKASKNFTDLNAAMNKGFSLKQISAVTRYEKALASARSGVKEYSATYFDMTADIEADYERRKAEIEAGGAKGGGPKPLKTLPSQEDTAEKERSAREQKINSDIQYFEYIDQNRQAEILKEQEKYEQLLALQTGFEKNREELQAAYKRRELLALKNADKQKQKQNVAYLQGRLGLLNAEWVAFKEIAGYSSTLMQSNNKVVFGAGKALAYAQAIMNASTAVTKIWAQWGFPLGAVFSGIALAATGVQIAKIKGTEMQSFEKGRVPVLADGYVPSDHFPAMIGAKEAVITERATIANAGILAEMNRTGKAVNSGENIVVNQNVNLSGNVLSKDFILDSVMPELDTQARYAGKQLFAERG